MKIKVLDSKELKDFPSGSGIECYGDNVYLVGDDSKEVLVLSKQWKKLSAIPLLKSTEQRIPKKVKADLEATTIVEINKIPRLLILGSGSKEPRNKAILLNLDTLTKEEADIALFYQRINGVIKNINIESAAIILGKLVLGNRGNKSAPENQVIVTDIEFWKNQASAEIIISRLDLPQVEKQPLGLSGMTYSHLNDWLILTLSTEFTNNAIDDGPIGDSYLAIIENASRKVDHKKMKVNELINLSEANKVFRGHKVESVCIQSEKNGRLKLQLVAENDDGKSYLFKIRLKE